MRRFVDVHVYEIEDLDLRYVVANDIDGNAKIVAIRGTSKFRNVVTDARFDLVYDPLIGGRVHRGFLTASHAVMAELRRKLGTTRKVVTAGHSMGGAIAVIIAELLINEGCEVVETITFGQPMITDFEGSTFFRDIPLLRVMNGFDSIARVPFVSERRDPKSGYVHFGPEVLLLGGNTYYYIDPESVGIGYSRGYWDTWSWKKFSEFPGDHEMEIYLDRLDSVRVEPVHIDDQTNMREISGERP